MKVHVIISLSILSFFSLQIIASDHKHKSSSDSLERQHLIENGELFSHESAADQLIQNTHSKLSSSTVVKHLARIKNQKPEQHKKLVQSIREVGTSSNSPASNISHEAVAITETFLRKAGEEALAEVQEVADKKAKQCKGLFMSTIIASLAFLKEYCARKHCS